MTFSETIDALVKLYAKGMRAKTFERLEELKIADGMCVAALDHKMTRIKSLKRFQKYSPKMGYNSWYWFPTAKHVKFDDGEDISNIKAKAIRPRLELLKRIQKDLNKEKIYRK